MLYDRRSEELILGKTLWCPNHLSQAVNTITKPYTNTDVLAEDTIDDKVSALNVRKFPRVNLLGRGNMEVLVKALPSISVDRKGSVGIKED